MGRCGHLASPRALSGTQPHLSCFSLSLLSYINYYLMNVNRISPNTQCTYIIHWPTHTKYKCIHYCPHRHKVYNIIHGYLFLIDIPLSLFFSRPLMASLSLSPSLSQPHSGRERLGEREREREATERGHRETWEIPKRSQRETTERPWRDQREATERDRPTTLTKKTKRNGALRFKTFFRRNQNGHFLS